MNSDNIFQTLQTAFHVTLGATASLVESIQDPIKREQNLSQLSNWNEQVREWEAKGEVAEREARNLVDSLLSQQNSHQDSTAQQRTSSPSGTVPVSPPVQPDIQLELQQLTVQLAAMRAELEKLRNPDSSV